MLRLLYIIPYAPGLIRPRSYHLIRTLARRGHRIALATLWENAGERQVLSELAELGVDLIAQPAFRSQKIKNLGAAFLNGKPLQARYSWSPLLAAGILEKLAAAADTDLIHIEHLRGSEYGYFLRSNPGRGRRIPIVWDSVDCISHLFEQAVRQSRSGFGKWMSRFELGRTRRYEGAAVRKFERVLVTSAIDRQALIQLAGGNSANTLPPIDILPNGVDLRTFHPIDEPYHSDTIVFTGKLSYHANVTAAMMLIDRIMPLVWSERPALKLQVVGKDPPAGLRIAARRDSRVQIKSNVPEMQVYLARAAVAVAPIVYGAGIQNKILEALACGTPVVASPHALAPLQIRAGEEILEGKDDQGMADQILLLVNNPARRAELAAAGLRFVRGRYDWETIVSSLESIYDKTIH